MKFSRDKRGYEHTFLVQPDRRRGRLKSRVLYWFRTPPGVRVGRAAFDEAAIQLIEQHNPDVEFDWTRILKGEGAPPPAPRSERHGGDRARERGRQPPQPAQPPRPQAEPPDPVAEAAPAAIEASEPELSQPPEPVELPAPVEDNRPTAAGARLGAEGLLRLRARHAEVLARISERVTDPVRREQLKAEADRLNPDTWVTEADVNAGLEQYESVFESLRGVVGTQRRRGRRGRPRGARGADQPASTGETGAQASGDVDRAGPAEDVPGAGENE